MARTGLQTIRAIFILLALGAALLLPGYAWAPAGGVIASAAPARQGEGGEEVPEETLDDLALLLNWAGGGAAGVIGRLCDLSAASGGAPCQIAQNEIMRVNVNDVANVPFTTGESGPTFVLRLNDDRELAAYDEAGDVLFWWIPPLAEPGSATLIVRQGSSTERFPVRIGERSGQPLITAAWQRDGPDAPTELRPASRAGNRLAVHLVGFPPEQEVSLVLFRLVESRALADFAAFDRPLAAVSTDERGTATYVWDTDRDEQPGRYAIHTIPESQANGPFANQGAQFCIAPRGEPDLCASESSAVGPMDVIEPLVARTVTLAAQTWARLGHNAALPLTDLTCAYTGNALVERQQQLQALRARGDVLDARLNRSVDVQSIVEANPAVMHSGIEATVVERWDGKVIRPDGSEDEIEPRRQTWRYLLRRGETGTFSPSQRPCGSGLVITEAHFEE